VSRIDWSKYLSYFSQINTRQLPVSEERRKQIENLLAELVEIPESDCSDTIGTAYGFGNDTEVVVHLHITLGSGAIANPAADFTGPLAFRIMREGRGNDTIEFLRQRVETGYPLNGPQHIHFQRSLGVIQRDGYNLVIQEWIPGETLEWLRLNHWNAHPLSGESAQEILRQILLGVVIPAWTVATVTSGVLWDIRDANFVLSGYEATSGQIRVAFVDTWHLRHLTRPVPTREGQIKQGLRRLQRRMERILLNQGQWEMRPTRFRQRFEQAFEASELTQHLRLLADQEPPCVKSVEKVCRDFLDELREQGLFRNGTIATKEDNQ
jgi:hypothetical protein